MNIETASGFTARNVTPQQLTVNLAGLDGGNDFLILSDGEDYLQCAWSQTGFTAEYQDASGHYSSQAGLPLETIEELFSAYLARSGGWRSLVVWESAGSGASPAADRSDEGGAGLKDALKGQLSPDNLLKSVKRQVSSEVNRAVSRKTSGIIGRLVRKILK
jgi:hypothetical protein